jgi:hypothetical protein
MPERFGFTAPPHPEAAEWMGPLIGLSNTLTRSHSLSRSADRDLDARPGGYERMRDACRRAMEGPELFIHDVVIFGVRLRLSTNSFHLADFWRENFFSPLDWLERTGRRAPEQPEIQAFAFTGLADEPEAAAYSRRHRTIFIFGNSYYGQLKSWALGAVGLRLAAEGIHPVRAAAVQRGGSGLLLIGPAGTEKSTAAYAIMELGPARLHSDDYCFLRYGYRRPSGQVVCPRESAAHRRLLSGAPGDGKIRVESLDGERFEIAAGDLEPETLAAFAFPSEKKYYRRTSFVENFPGHLGALLRAKTENVPAVTPETLQREGPALDRLAADANRPLGREKLRETLLRLVVSDYGRALLDPADLFGADRVFRNPLEPMRLDAAVLLRQNLSDDLLVESLEPSRFLERVVRGETPDGRRETGYNSYRFPGAESEEEELFSLLARAARTCELNLILTKNLSRREAALACGRLLIRLLERPMSEPRLWIRDFERTVS